MAYDIQSLLSVILGSLRRFMRQSFIRLTPFALTRHRIPTLTHKKTSSVSLPGRLWEFLWNRPRFDLYVYLAQKKITSSPEMGDIRVLVSGF